ncbi:hypothetical protein C475_15263 [Halosimplex carlsbadense 2-9-1]|uniref:Uncharacterized protein n=1 Tax=Halosimplex carlsbadense 2-9-1 TaxID=797114 RepID=M0CML9_9EURY|nr:hypothetical protein C475_15263 [Halosimplex carlsbadense 2-9-1]
MLDLDPKITLVDRFPDAARDVETAVTTFRCYFDFLRRFDFFDDKFAQVFERRLSNLVDSRL